jgi:hypothetical protein
MGRNRVNMTLTADRFVPQPAAGIHHNAKEQHPPLEFVEVLIAAHIHGNGINRVRAGAVWIPQAATNGIE